MAESLVACATHLPTPTKSVSVRTKRAPGFYAQKVPRAEKRVGPWRAMARRPCTPLWRHDPLFGGPGRKRHHVGVADSWIAATALEHDPLVSSNAGVEGLTVAAETT